MIGRAWEWVLGKVYRKLMNRGHLAPPVEDGVCQVPGCANAATEQWMPSVCALRESGVEIDWVHVCTEHDIQLNESITRLVFGDQYDGALAAYAERRRHEDQ